MGDDNRFRYFFLFTILIPFLGSMALGYMSGRTDDWLVRAALTALAVAVLGAVYQTVRIRRLAKQGRGRRGADLIVASANAVGMTAFLGFSAGVIWFH